jgi:hypothetical protein
MRTLLRSLSLPSLSLVTFAALGVAGATGCGSKQCICDCEKGCNPAGGTAGSGGTGGSSGGQGGAGAQGGQGGEAGQGGQGGGGQGGQGGTGGQGGGGGQPPLWEAPNCDLVSGTPAVTFSKDAGATFAPTSGQLPDIAYTTALAVLTTPGHVLAETSGDVIRSTDGGCTWTKIGDAGDIITRLVAAGESRAYGYGPGSAHLYRVDGDAVTILPPPAGVLDIRGLGVDRSNPDRLRLGEQDGTLFESSDGGLTFAPVGVPSPNGCFYTMAFDPGDLDHVLCGTLGDGVSVTFDGGATWAPGEVPLPANAFSFGVSPVDGNRVWLRAVYSLSDDKGVLISSDGGKTFAPVLVDGQQGFSTYNGPPLTPDVLDADVVYFPTPLDLYRFDVGQNLLETLDPHPFYQTESVAVAPSAPPIVYVGLTQEIIPN